MTTRTHHHPYLGNVPIRRHDPHGAQVTNCARCRQSEYGVVCITTGEDGVRYAAETIGCRWFRRLHQDLSPFAKRIPPDWPDVWTWWDDAVCDGSTDDPCPGLEAQ